MQSLFTERLEIRPLQLADAPDVERLINDPEIAGTTLNIPYPYPEGGGTQFIQFAQELIAKGTGYHMALRWRETGEFIGSIGLSVNARFQRGELAYWVARPFWGRGIATEAAREMMRFGFEELKLNRIFAQFFPRNPASGKVMEKLGMTYEGTLRQHLMRDGRFEDAVQYGILRSEWERWGEGE